MYTSLSGAMGVWQRRVAAAAAAGGERRRAGLR